jgi:hypothetical protein
LCLFYLHNMQLFFKKKKKKKKKMQMDVMLSHQLSYKISNELLFDNVAI